MVGSAGSWTHRQGGLAGFAFAHSSCEEPQAGYSHVRWAVTWILNNVPDAKAKEFGKQPDEHLLLFTDGAVEDQVASIGGVLFDSTGQPLQFFSATVPLRLCRRGNSVVQHTQFFRQNCWQFWWPVTFGTSFFYIPYAQFSSITTPSNML